MAPWRASPSRPAPPVASTHPDNPSHSFDSLFAGPSSSRSSRTPSAPSPSGSAAASAPARTLSSSSSAYSFLSRKMAEMEDEDDRMSIRSGVSARSGVTLSARTGGGSDDRNGSGSGSTTAKARSRAQSSASSVRTARGRSESIVEDDDPSESMDVDEPAPTDAKGKGKEPDTLSPSSAVKRQRTRAPSLLGPSDRAPRRRSSFQPSSNPSGVVSTSQPTLSTTTADDLMPSMRKKPDRAASVSSASTSTKSLTRPSLPSNSSIATLKPPRSPSMRKSTSRILETPSSSSEPEPLSTSPTASLAPSQRSGPSSLARRSWFGRAPLDAAPAPVAETAAPASPSPDEAMTAAPALGEPAGPPSTDSTGGETPLDESAPPPAAPTEPASLTAAAPQSRGWLAILARSRPSALNLAAQARAAESAAADDAMQVDSPVPDQEAEGEATPPATPRAARPDDSTLRGPPPQLAQEQSAAANDSTSREPAGQAAMRGSWFGWGWGGAPAEPAAVDATEPAAADEHERERAAPTASTAPEPEVASAQPDPESTLTAPLAADDASMPGSGWLSAIWSSASAVTGGAGPSAEVLADQRRREAWALKLAAQNAARDQKAIEAAPVQKGAGEREEEASGDTVRELQAPTPAQQIKHRASSSWSLFSRTPGSIASLRAPLVGLGVTSSAASTRSHTSSQAPETAPSSPQLRAQSDQGALKPLTGSIRSSPRQGRSSALEPPTPVDNLVLPTFNDTFLRPPRSFPPRKSPLTRAVSAVSAYLFHRPPDELTSPRLAQAQLAAGVIAAGLPTEMKDDPAERLPKSLEAVSEPPRLEKVKRVVTIGVHGWFTSNNMIKSVMGEQTGTSVKFATMMHDAVQSYLESHDLGSFNIQAIALEGQGMVEDRVGKLYAQLIAREEWIRALKMADAVFLATHSQGCVVSTQLLARMLDQGLVVGTQTHLLAMCGISQGPFVYLYQSIALAPYFNYLESAPARELFEFQNPESVAAINLRLLLNAGVKITAVGSINDQVVPLYSALFSGVDHPGILRAVFIDSDAFRTSDFLANLVVFSARLRNAGLADHDLVYHVSEALAGALTGVGHSKIYEEADVYRLAVRYHFETTTLTEAPTSLDPHVAAPPLSMSFNPRDRRNPYLLTWALRGIIEDPQVRQLFGNELAALREAYDTWRPQTKVLKDVKLKLEGIRLMAQRPGKL
ncbi:hypothetical protein JCM10450v2_002711 [Rhodotorula kratochvilovae]